MTIYDLVKSIGARLVRCHLQICGFAVISLLLGLMGQGVYVLTAWAASFMTDPMFGYAAHSYRIILFATAVIMLFTVLVLSEYRFFRGMYRDIQQYFAARHRTSRAP